MIAHNKERNQQLASYLGHRRISSELLLFLLNCNDLRFIRHIYVCNMSVCVCDDFFSVLLLV